MKRAVIYARYSTDLQNDKSVEDQISLCRDYATRHGFEVVNEFFDRAKSGASMFGRPGLANLMQAAERQEFDAVISESPDRISRDIADLAHVHKTTEISRHRNELRQRWPYGYRPDWHVRHRRPDAARRRREESKAGNDRRRTVWTQCRWQGLRLCASCGKKGRVGNRRAGS